MKTRHKIISLFSGCGGLDLGFKMAGFNVVWSNEYDAEIWATYEKNHKNTQLDKRSIINIHPSEIPECVGIIAGPPCQSWSVIGSSKGIKDKRGQLFFEFIRILDAKKPKFFLAENVPGILSPKHGASLQKIKASLKKSGYVLSLKLLNAADYGVPQDRKRVFIVGIRSDLNFKFEFPKMTFPKITLKETISDLQSTAIPTEHNKTNGNNCLIVNHEYMTDGFSSRYMSSNRVRSWDEQSFTIQAGGRHAPIHPQAPKMESIGKEKRIFNQAKLHLYRRLSVRECARIQTFPDDFVLHYDKVTTGYKMIGNAVPVALAKFLAENIKAQINGKTS